MTITEYDDTELLSVNGKLRMAKRYGHSNRAELEIELLTIQVSRDLATLAERAAVLSDETRAALVEFFSDKVL